MLIVTGIRPGRREREKLTDKHCRTIHFTSHLDARKAAFEEWQRGFLSKFRIERVDLDGRPSPPTIRDTR